MPISTSTRTTVKFTLDTKRPPKLTASQRKRLAAIAALPDKDIDYSDIGRSNPKSKWKRANA